MFGVAPDLAFFGRRLIDLRTIARTYGIFNMAALEATVHEDDLAASLSIIDRLFHNQSATSSTCHAAFLSWSGQTMVIMTLGHRNDSSTREDIEIPKM
jgi:hypothetical protein